MESSDNQIFRCSIYVTWDFLKIIFFKRIFGQISTKNKKTNTIGKKQSPLFISFSGPQEVM